LDYALVAGGRTATACATWLNDRGITTSRGGRWRQEAVCVVLRNPVYKGAPRALRYQRVEDELSRETQGRSRVEVEHVALPPGVAPALISAETWDQAQAQLAAGQTGARRNLKNPEEYLLRGLVVCSECGGTLSCTNKKNKNGAAYYMCANRVRLGCRHPMSVTAARLNQEVWNTVLLVAQNPQWIREQLAQRDDDGGVASLLAERRESLRQLVAREIRVLAVLETGDLDDPSALAGRLNEIGAAKQIIEREIAELEAQQARAEQESRGLAGLERRLFEEYRRVGELSFDGRRALLRYLGVSRVTLYPQGHQPRWAMEWAFDLSAWYGESDDDAPEVSFAVSTEISRGSSSSARPRRDRWSEPAKRDGSLSSARPPRNGPSGAGRTTARRRQPRSC
jgi:hypothetical protein